MMYVLFTGSSNFLPLPTSQDKNHRVTDVVEEWMLGEVIM